MSITPNGTAYTDLIEVAGSKEKIKAIVFGEWGWGGYQEPNPPPVPATMQGKVLSLEEAKPMMQSWRFFCDHGSPKCYAIYAWTDANVIFVSEYDGACRLERLPLTPEGCTELPKTVA